MTREEAVEYALAEDEAEEGGGGVGVAPLVALAHSPGAVDKGLTVGDMKGTLLFMIQSLYGKDRKVRVRPSYFPFTEPSFEFDVTCGICGGMGCKSCRHKGWLEVGGCGMVHPQVLRNGGIDPTQWNGYAWGFGIERMAMLKHDVDDIRLFYESDLRFLEQF